MKKLTFLEIFTYIFLLSGCSYITETDVKITNRSSVPVTFTIDGYGDDLYTLASGEAMTKELYTVPKLTFSGSPRVIAASGNTIVNIEDMAKIKYSITALSGTAIDEDLTVIEANGMMGVSPSDKVILSPVKVDGSVIGTYVYVFNTEKEYVYYKNEVYKPVFRAYLSKEYDNALLNEDERTDMSSYIVCTALNE